MTPPETLDAQSLPQTLPARTPAAWPDYRAVWRWHFYAGLCVLPFVTLLSITGSLYLFKTEFEAWTERRYDQLEPAGPRTTAAAHIQAALAALPGATFQSYELPQTDRSAARVIVRQEGAAIRAYVHPETAAVLGTVVEQDRFMRQMFRLHGELMLGDRGSNLVELAACWTIVMILTGLYLWWPRQGRGLAGVLYPRLFAGGRLFWKDLHAVAGIWISASALFLLMSGLPWAKFWGEYFKTVRRVTGTAVARQEWSNSSTPRARRGGEHEGHGGRGRREAGPPPDFTAVDRIAAVVQPLGLPHPVVIAPPARGSEHWSVKSMTPNRPLRENLEVHGRTGEIVSRDGFAEKHVIDQAVSIGIAAHEGRLFGWPNQLLGLLTAAGLVLLSVSGVILWWRRRDRGVLGAPPAGAPPRVSFGLAAIVVVLAVLLPLFGASLLVVLILDRLLFSRIPATRRWLGLRPA